MYQPRKDERLSRPWSHPVVLNTGTLDWESSTLTTRLFPHETAKLAYATKAKQSIASQKLGSQDFWRVANSVLNKGKSAVPPLFKRLDVLSSALDKAKLFAKNISNNSNLDDSGIFLPVFPSRTYLKLHNTSITPKMIEKVITKP